MANYCFWVTTPPGSAACLCRENTAFEGHPGCLANLPLYLLFNGFYRIYTTGTLDNIIAGLEHTDRVCQIMCIDLLGSDLETVLVAMQMPFPNLTHLDSRTLVGSQNW